LPRLQQLERISWQYYNDFNDFEINDNLS